MHILKGFTLPTTTTSQFLEFLVFFLDVLSGPWKSLKQDLLWDQVFEGIYFSRQLWTENMV